MVLVGNKVDVKDRKVKPKQITFHRKKNGVQYYDLSAKSNYNIEKPFLYLCKRLLNDHEVRFVEQPAIAPPELPPIDEATIKQYEEAWKDALAAPLMDEEDEDL